MEDPCSFQPLLRTTNTAAAANATISPDDNDPNHINKLTSPNSRIILRLLSVVSIGIISLWANHEASKGFDVTIINDADDTPAGKRFTLWYMSNDKATRIVLNTSSFVENFLYPNSNHTTKNKVHHVTLHLAADNPPNMVSVNPKPNNEFVIKISSSIMDDTKHFDDAVISTILQGMARVWLWSYEPRAPSWLIDGMVEYINGLAGFSCITRDLGDHFCRGNKEAKAVAQFLYYTERDEKGLIQRLKQGLTDGTVEDAAALWVQNFCNSYTNSSQYSSSY